MNIHKDARLTPEGRERLLGPVDGDMSYSQAALICGTSSRTAAKWYRRFRAEGPGGLSDRRSRPHILPAPTAQEVCAQIVSLRRERLTGAQIAAKTGVSAATSLLGNPSAQKRIIRQRSDKDRGAWYRRTCLSRQRRALSLGTTASATRPTIASSPETAPINDTNYDSR